MTMMVIMQESTFRAQVKNAIWNSGVSYWPLVYSDTSICPKCRAPLHPIPNRPDIILATSGVECKVSEGTFSFSSITEGQREWADSRTKEGFVFWFALFMQEEKEKRAWLVDWPHWTMVETTLKAVAGQHSIPMKARKGMKRIIQDQGLDAITMLKGYDLVRKKSDWIIPDTHPIRSLIAERCQDQPE